MDKKRPSSKRYPPELKERVVRMVRELRLEDPRDQGVIGRVARQLGMGKESLRAWEKQAEVNADNRKPYQAGFALLVVIRSALIS